MSTFNISKISFVFENYEYIWNATAVMYDKTFVYYIQT